MGIYERKQREKEQRKVEILEAARKVFSTKGFNSATMEEIASEAELSPGTLYLYFKNKEELHTSLSIEVLKHLVKKVEELVARDISIEEKIEQINDIFIDMYDYDSNILINLFHLQSGETLKNLSDEVLESITTFSSRSHRAIVKVIREGIDQGIFIDEHPVALADILWSTFSGIVLWVGSKRFLDDQKDFVKSTLRTAFSIIHRGMKNN